MFGLITRHLQPAAHTGSIGRRSRLEPNLRALVARDLLAKREADERATAYRFTGVARTVHPARRPL
ncbi:hypothetical protein [Natrinema sp. 1APR25-10V2]|uniref:hypothetical protein n=1 Tax=Natrinema sp. 1APR25-10V2 TaxID=2951081 RepID=UPI002874AEA6|nr:hypothetical protein [Natrinema sp. 1APR25-10V2]MDS0473415.1 hypothetical protein [Natrinema sp. 1APR25-10V2]